MGDSPRDTIIDFAAFSLEIDPVQYVPDEIAFDAKLMRSTPNV
jgi:hypothetical protein